MIPWIKLYQPKTIKDIEGQESAVRQLKEFIENFKKQKKKASIIYGPTGCGKTAAAYALANELGLELIEVNASDFRNAENIKSTVGSAAKQQSLFSKGKIILVDEIDGLSGMEDRGGVTALAELIDETGFPIVCTANDPFDKKFASLRKKCSIIEFNEINYANIAKILSKICKKEGIKAADDDISSLARRAGGDVRAAINDLQSISHEKKELKKEDIDGLGQREREETIINALLKVFKTTDPNIAINAFDNVAEDFDKRFLWLDENLPKEYEKPEDLARAYDYISKADVMSRRIRRWQHWRFLVYVNAFLTAGISVSKDEKYKKFVSYGPTQRLLKIYIANMKYQKRKAIAAKIAEKTHSSAAAVIKDTLPFLQEAMRKNKNFANEIAEEFELDKDEVEWMRK